uniref:Putative DNA binding, helix-turn-helix domain containing protein n=1 Tax=viral metagenome TaxID=1070528 RepID=A0A6H1Z7A4_9ZZZZ
MRPERLKQRKQFGNWIKIIRQDSGFSLWGLSKKLGYESRGTLANIEQGIGPLPVEQIHPIAKALNIEVSELLEKIKECEPELYEKYTTLERDITRHFSSRIMQRPELALHHKPFPQKGTSSDNDIYANFRGRGSIYIM